MPGRPPPHELEARSRARELAGSAARREVRGPAPAPVPGRTPLRRKGRTPARGALEMQRFRELRGLLEEKRREVLTAIQRSRMAGMEVRQESVPEMGDFVTASVEKEQIFEMGETGVEVLREVEDALERLQAGTYGVCQRCNERIAIARLTAIPFARFCVSCQELEERGAPA